MSKMVFNKRDIENLVKKIINESAESTFNLSTEGKLEFVLTSLKDLIKDAVQENDGNVHYYAKRLSKIVNMVDSSYVNEDKTKFNKVMHEFGTGKLKTPNGEKVTDQKQALAIAYSESGLSESTQSFSNFNITKVKGGVILSVESASGRGKQIIAIPSNQIDELFKLIKQTDSELTEGALNEWRPNVGYDEWADLETNGGHRQGIQNRKNFTRKENAKYEKVSDLKKPSDFMTLIYKWGKEGYAETDRIYKAIIRKYNNKQFTLGDIHKISEFGSIQNAPIVQMLKDFVDVENEKTNFYPKNFREIDTTKPTTQQPK